MGKHKPTSISEPGLLDRVVCSCGWESFTYFDGMEYAMNDHKRHVRDMERGKLAVLKSEPTS